MDRDRSIDHFKSLINLNLNPLFLGLWVWVLCFLNVIGRIIIFTLLNVQVFEDVQNDVLESSKRSRTLKNALAIESVLSKEYYNLKNIVK